MIRPALFAVALLYSIIAFSQVPPKIKKSIRAEMLLPHAVTNKAFTKVFSGVFNLNISMNLGFKNFNLAPYYGLMQSQIFPRLQSDPHTIQTVHSAGLRYSYDIYPSAETMKSIKGNFIMVSPFISGGYNWIDYSRLVCITEMPYNKHTTAYNVCMGANFNLMFTQWDGVGFTLGYNYLNHRFDPDALCLNEFYSFTDKQKHGMANYILFGFNLFLDLAKRPDSAE